MSQGERINFLQPSQARQRFRENQEKQPMEVPPHPNYGKAPWPGEFYTCQKLSHSSFMLGAGRRSTDKQEGSGALQSEGTSVLPFQHLIDPLDRSSLL